jgi:thioredoxin-dependent peroxiredoxin
MKTMMRGKGHPERDDHHRPAPSACGRYTASMPLAPNSPAPDFTLPDQVGKPHSLKDERGKWVLIYFYPKDDTPGCTAEACGLRDAMADYRRAGCTVFGVSADSQAKHKKFADKYGLPFTLLSDETKETIQAYGAWQEKKFVGRTYMGIVRMSYLIDPDGNIVKIYPKVSPEEHAAEVLADIEGLRKR